jgi:hypothetical protein
MCGATLNFGPRHLDGQHDGTAHDEIVGLMMSGDLQFCSNKLSSQPWQKQSVHSSEVTLPFWISLSSLVSIAPSVHWCGHVSMA